MIRCRGERVTISVSLRLRFQLTGKKNQAANYLDIQALLDTACRAVSNMIKGKSPREIRETFMIKNDFTPEQ